jgi:Glycosyl transferase family 11
MPDHTLVIFTHGAGRLANQLLSHAHLLAFCLEAAPRFSLLNTAIRPYCRNLGLGADRFGTVPFLPLTVLARAVALATTTEHPSLRYHLTRMGLKILYVARRLDRNASAMAASDVSGFGRVPCYDVGAIDLGSPDAVGLLNSAPRLLLCGWRIRSWRLLAKHREEVLRSLALSAPHLELAHREIGKFRETSDYLIGVHIRQGDYALWNRGRHYHDTRQYVTWMRTAVERFADRGRIGFVVCSDRPQPRELFAGLNVLVSSDANSGAAVRDLIRLSRCDLLMAPPSTYGCWASLMGTVPILPLRSKQMDVASERILPDGIFAAAADSDFADILY